MAEAGAPGEQHRALQHVAAAVGRPQIADAVLTERHDHPGIPQAAQRQGLAGAAIEEINGQFAESTRCR